MAASHGDYAVAAKHSPRPPRGRRRAATPRFSPTGWWPCALAQKQGQHEEAESVVARLRCRERRPGAARPRCRERALAAHLTDTDPGPGRSLHKRCGSGGGGDSRADHRHIAPRGHRPAVPRCLPKARDVTTAHRGCHRGFPGFNWAKAARCLTRRRCAARALAGRRTSPLYGPALGPSDALVDLALEPDGLVAYVVTDAGLKVVRTPGADSTLEAADRGDLRQCAAPVW